MAERERKTGGVDPVLDNILVGDTHNMSTDDPGQLRPFGNQMFNPRLNILLPCTLLPLDILRRATAEVVGSAFFRDDILMPGPGSTFRGMGRKITEPVERPNRCAFALPCTDPKNHLTNPDCLLLSSIC